MYNLRADSCAGHDVGETGLQISNSVAVTICSRASTNNTGSNPSYRNRTQLNNALNVNMIQTTQLEAGRNPYFDIIGRDSRDAFVECFAHQKTTHRGIQQSKEP